MPLDVAAQSEDLLDDRFGPWHDRLRYWPLDGRRAVAYSPSFVSSSRLLTLAKIRSWATKGT